MSSQDGFEGANELLLHCVHAEQFDGDATDGGDADYLVASPPKVMIPALQPRMEQTHGFGSPGIAPSDAGTFVKRTVNTGEREVIQVGFSAGDQRLNMVDVECRRLTQLRQSAVFAAMIGSFDDAPTKTGRHSHMSGSASFHLGTQLQNRKH